MQRVWRAFVLPLIALALLAQGLAPAPAMARDAFGQPICTERGVDRQTPPPAHAHDCCPAACHSATLLAPPPTQGVAIAAPAAGRAASFAHAALRGPRGPPDRFAEARGPPFLS